MLTVRQQPRMGAAKVVARQGESPSNGLGSVVDVGDGLREQQIFLLFFSFQPVLGSFDFWQNLIA